MLSELGDSVIDVARVVFEFVGYLFEVLESVFDQWL